MFEEKQISITWHDLLPPRQRCNIVMITTFFQHRLTNPQRNRTVEQAPSHRVHGELCQARVRAKPCSSLRACPSTWPTPVHQSSTTSIVALPTIGIRRNYTVIFLDIWPVHTDGKCHKSIRNNLLSVFVSYPTWRKPTAVHLANILKHEIHVNI